MPASVIMSLVIVSAITTRSSAYNNFYGKATLNSVDNASKTITITKGLNAELWCIPTFTSKSLLLPKTDLTTVFAPVYIDMIADTNHSSTPNVRIANLITSLGTLSKAFFNPQSRNRASFL